MQREIKVSFSYLLFLSYSFDAKVKAKPRNVFAARLNLFCQEVHSFFFYYYFSDMDYKSFSKSISRSITQRFIFKTERKKWNGIYFSTFKYELSFTEHGITQIHKTDCHTVPSPFPLYALYHHQTI